MIIFYYIPIDAIQFKKKHLKIIMTN